MFSDILKYVTPAHLCLVLVTGLGVYYLSWIIYASYLHPYADIPGPPLAKISRLWIGASVGKGNAEHTQRALHRRLGALVRIAHDEVSVSDPDAVKVIYNVKGGVTKTDFYPPFASNISPCGDHFSQLNERKHAERRKFVNHIYSMSTILESETYINGCGDVFLEKMAVIAKDSKIVDFGEWIQWYTFDVIGELFFGHQFGFMRDEHNFSRYIESLDTLLPGIAMSCVLAAYLRPFRSTLDLVFPSIRDSIKGFDEIRAAGHYGTSDRLQKRQSKRFERKDLLEKFFVLRDQREGWDIPDIANEACVAIFAGSDTTAVAIRSIFYYLMKNRDALAKLAAKIDDFDSKGQISHPHVAYAEAVKMPYLVACCKEGMRLHPSVGLGMPRHVPAGGVTIAGRYFPEGSKVSFNAAVLHYEDAVFGPHADWFMPERWLEGDALNMDKHMLHFGGGSRTCLGNNISLAEMHKLIPTLLRKFDVALAEPDKDWETHNFWFNKQLGINVKVTQRSRSYMRRH